MKATPEHRAQLMRATAQRIGIAGYVRMLGSIRYRAKSSAEIAAEIGVSRAVVLLAMRHWLHHGIVHRVDWHRVKPRGRMKPRWALGPHGDVSMPAFEVRVDRPQRARSSVILITATLQVLSEAPTTRDDLARQMCMHRETVSRVVRLLHEARLVYVASWEQPPVGTTVAEMEACLTGVRPDRPRPPRRVTKQDSKTTWTRRRRMAARLHAMAGAASGVQA